MPILRGHASIGPRRTFPRTARSLALAFLAASVLAACQAGAYALECNQGVQRDPCERAAAFAFDKADVAASRVHVEARSCTRYFEEPPADTHCWSVRLEKEGDFTVVAVTQTGDGDLTEAQDLIPIFPSPSPDGG
jgi:hypothetical protein